MIHNEDEVKPEKEEMLFSGIKSEKLSLSGSAIKESAEKHSQKKFIMNNDDHLIFKLFFGKILRRMSYVDEEQKVFFILK